MRFQPFTLEQFLSDYEQSVEYNYTESGVHPVPLGELMELSGRSTEELLQTPLNYPEVNGDRALRERIAALYPDAGPENVLVTVGASEANLLAATTLLEPGDEVLALRPTYLQFAGIARNMGVTIRTVDLVEEEGWALDVDALAAAVTPRTRVVSVVNPANPCGSILGEAEIDAVVGAARRADAWLLADEVYSGAERGGREPTPTLYGRYEKVLAVNSLSKAYGLPGLRCGWVVGPRETIAALWRRHEYAVIGAGMLANRLAATALAPEVRPRLIARTRALIDEGYRALQRHLGVHEGVFSLVPPKASAIAFVRYDLPLNSTDLAHRLREEKSVLVVPGDCFGMDRHLRINFALPPPYLDAGLGRMNELIAGIAA